MTEKEHGSVAMGDSREAHTPWRAFEDIQHGWWGIEVDGTNDAEPILYPIKISRERIDGLVDAHNAALSRPAQEPVAWRYRMSGWGEEYWHYFTNEPRSKDDDEIWEPLYAAPQPAHGTSATERGPDVKALEWVKSQNMADEPQWQTHGSALNYCITLKHRPGIGEQFRLFETGGWFPTMDEAKAAAQADYEQRIRSALATPTPKEESK